MCRGEVGFDRVRVVRRWESAKTERVDERMVDVLEEYSWIIRWRRFKE